MSSGRQKNIQYKKEGGIHKKEGPVQEPYKAPYKAVQGVQGFPYKAPYKARRTSETLVRTMILLYKI